MPRYAILGDHTPLSCPGSSKSAEAFAAEALGKQLPVRQKTAAWTKPFA